MGYTSIDHEKNVIVHPDVDTRRELVNLSQSQIVHHIDEQHTVEGSGFFSLEDPPEDVYITYEKIKPLDWIVWVGKSTDVLTNMYRNSILTIIIILFLTTITMVGASLLLTNRLEKTIRQLLNYIKEYTVGFKQNHIRTKKIQGPKARTMDVAHCEPQRRRAHARHPAGKPADAVRNEPQHAEGSNGRDDEDRRDAPVIGDIEREPRKRCNQQNRFRRRSLVSFT
ncbi:hypothetical protein N2384_04940 [Bacillus paralicheniformis]|uniref:hypothetical protein n=1 Tax=Bacillus paralicheniformis TaxID=1648923 RepID=UPI0021A6C996|nr:hypothetical protein [Bacillus paralicheniformis]UWS62498.1 hypothetical protein N2384_04940 [Bacillus paralicheniformis]